MNTHRIAKTAMVASMYTILTVILSPISYGPIQFRLSEVLVLLAFINKDYIIGLTIGCLIANLLGPYGLPDVVFGTLATFISVYLVYITPKFIKGKSAIWIASIWPSIVNGVIIAFMLKVFLNIPFVLSMLQIAVGEFGTVTVIGVPLFKLLKYKYPNFLKSERVGDIDEGKEHKSYCSWRSCNKLFR